MVVIEKTTSNLLKPLMIGHHQLPNNLALAPMAGVADLPWRNLCREWGAGYAVGEMLHSRSDLLGRQKSQFRVAQQQEQAPIAVQLLGNHPQDMARAACQQAAAGAEIIDINMGCPAKKVCSAAAGSALLADERLVAQILSAVVRAIPEKVVTLKIRTGTDPMHKNAVCIAQIAENEGVQLLSVHGRTRMDKFLGEAEYDTIAQVVQSVSIPVLANGDIHTPEKAAWVLAYTQAAGVMIGRAANGNPWLFAQMAHYLRHGEHLAMPDEQHIRGAIYQHIRAIHQFYGDHLGVRMARKHLAYYATHQPWLRCIQCALMRAETAEAQSVLLHD